MVADWILGTAIDDFGQDLFMSPRLDTERQAVSCTVLMKQTGSLQLFLIDG